MKWAVEQGKKGEQSRGTRAIQVFIHNHSEEAWKCPPEERGVRREVISCFVVTSVFDFFFFFKLYRASQHTYVYVDML